MYLDCIGSLSAIVDESSGGYMCLVGDFNAARNTAFESVIKDIVDH